MSTEKAKNAAIYREAARLMACLSVRPLADRTPGACWAILQAVGIPDGKKNVYAYHPRLHAFQELFAPEHFTCGSFWWDQDNEGLRARVIALCFMAAITERP